MKHTGLLLVCGAVALAAANEVVFEPGPNTRITTNGNTVSYVTEPTVEWQYDGYRAERAKTEAQIKWATEFNRTNTDSQLWANNPGWIQP